MKNKLILKNISAGYGKQRVIKDISFKLGPTENSLIIGPNGSGKSTVLKTIFGLITPEKGKICHKGKDITGLSPRKINKQGIRYLTQEKNFFKSLTVEEHFRLSKNEDLSPEDIYSKFPKLEDLKKEKAKTLSGGEKQMMALGTIMMEKPDLIMLDEPTAGLSPDLKREVYSFVERFKPEDSTLLIVEQNIDQAMKFADKTLVVREGEIVDKIYGEPSMSRIEKLYFNY